MERLAWGAYPPVLTGRLCQSSWCEVPPTPVSLFQLECFDPLPSLVLPWSPMNFSSGGFTLILEACKCSFETPL